MSHPEEERRRIPAVFLKPTGFFPFGFAQGQNDIASMRLRIILAALLIYTAITRFWNIGHIPPVASDAVLVGRFITAFASCVTLFVLNYCIRTYDRSFRTAILSCWMFAVAPWAIEQGRVFSPAQIFMPVLLFSLWMTGLLRFRILILVRSISITVAVGIFYWLLWEFQRDTGISPFNRTISNVFTLFSPNMLFLSNSTFWWGGIREFGMLSLSFVPFFVLGLLQVIHSRQWWVLSSMLIFGIIASLAPQFPEGRQFYPAFPLLSYIVAIGLNTLNLKTSRIFQAVVCFFLLIWTYEQMQYWHFYTVHYPIQVKSAVEKIVVPF